MDPEEIIHFLVRIKAGADSFNPYTQCCSLHDKVNGPLIRCRNFNLYLEAQIANEPTSIWVSEAPGYKGMRRTGVPLVPENLLEYASKKLRTREKFSKATKTPIQEIRTANDLWEIISLLDNPPFLWNLVMVHPHKIGNPMSNRKPRQNEIKLYTPLLKKLIDVFRFKQVIAVGKVAERELHKLGMQPRYVRHPAFGGKNKFRQQLLRIYST